MLPRSSVDPAWEKVLKGGRSNEVLLYFCKGSFNMTLRLSDKLASEIALIRGPPKKENIDKSFRSYCENIVFFIYRPYFMEVVYKFSVCSIFSREQADWHLQFIKVFRQKQDGG